MDPTDRYAALLAGPEAEVPLDEAALLIAAHAHPGLDVGAQLLRIDELAAGCAGADVAGLATFLFGTLGFRGDRCHYTDPANSFLPDVLDRRLGIPISLAVLAMEVGRRVGVPLLGVGMPGHFLARSVDEPQVYLDGFAGGRLLDAAGCEVVFRAVVGPDAPFADEYLAPVGTFTVLARMLANLRSSYAARGDREAVAWVLRLRTMTPGVPATERADLAGALAADGRFAEAAAEFRSLAALVGGDLGVEYERSAERLLARLN